MFNTFLSRTIEPDPHSISHWIRIPVGRRPKLKKYRKNTLKLLIVVILFQFQNQNQLLVLKKGQSFTTNSSKGIFFTTQFCIAGSVIRTRNEKKRLDPDPQKLNADPQLYFSVAKRFSNLAIPVHQLL